MTPLRIHDYVLTCEKRVGVILSLDATSNTVQIAYVDEAGEYDPDMENGISLPSSAIMHIICNLDSEIASDEN